MADYVKGGWEELGFDVTVKKLRYSVDNKDSTIIVDNYYTDYINGNFDVIAVDLTMLSSDAFSALAPYAVNYSGYGVNMEPKKVKDENGKETDVYESYGHVSGYKNSEYDALFDVYTP